MFARGNQWTGRVYPNRKLDSSGSSGGGTGLGRNYLEALIASAAKCPESISRYAITILAISFYLFANLMLVGSTTGGTSSFFQIVTATPAVHLAALLAFLALLWHVGDLARALVNLIYTALQESGRLRLTAASAEFRKEYFGAKVGLARQDVWKKYPGEAGAVRIGALSDIIDAFVTATASPGIFNPLFMVLLGTPREAQARRLFGTTRAILIIAIYAAGIGFVVGHVGAAGCRAGLAPIFWHAPLAERTIAQCDDPLTFLTKQETSAIKNQRGQLHPASALTARAPQDRQAKNQSQDGPSSADPFDWVAIAWNSTLGLVVFIVGGIVAFRVANNLALFMGQYRWLTMPPDDPKSVIILPHDPRYRGTNTSFQIHIDGGFGFLRILYPCLYAGTVLVAAYFAYMFAVDTDLPAYRESFSWSSAVRDGIDATISFISRFLV